MSVPTPTHTKHGIATYRVGAEDEHEVAIDLIQYTDGRPSQVTVTGDLSLLTLTQATEVAKRLAFAGRLANE